MSKRAKLFPTKPGGKAVASPQTHPRRVHRRDSLQKKELANRQWPFIQGKLPYRNTPKQHLLQPQSSESPEAMSACHLRAAPTGRRLMRQQCSRAVPVVPCLMLQQLSMGHRRLAAQTGGPAVAVPIVLVTLVAAVLTADRSGKRAQALEGGAPPQTA